MLAILRCSPFRTLVFFHGDIGDSEGKAVIIAFCPTFFRDSLVTKSVRKKRTIILSEACMIVLFPTVTEKIINI